jgi:hypothetical protein
MSFVNIGTDGPPNHTLEVDGDVFVSNVEQGTATNYVPVEVQGNLRLRIKPFAGVDDAYRVTDMQLNSTLFGITAPSPDASTSITDFCIDSSGNVGIGVIPIEKLDISGSMYATGSLTNESNLITATLSSSGTLTCNAIFHGVTSNIYGLLPTGAILMTTLTSTLDGWTDITSQFTDKNVLLAENQSTLTTGGNDTQSLAAISHNHTVSEHTTSHSHSTRWNANQKTTGSGGSHNHTLNTNTGTTSEDGHHGHSKSDVVVSPFNYGFNYGWYNQNRDILVSNQDSLTLTTGGPSSNYHSHSGGFGTYTDSSAEHDHYATCNISTTNDASDGTHTHDVSSVGDNNSINIVPPYYTLRFIKKN